VTQVLVVSPRGLLPYVPDVFSALLDQGAELVFAAKTKRVDRVKLPDRILEHAHASVVHVPLRRKGADAAAVEAFRILCDFVRFLDPALDGGTWPRTRIERRLRTLTKQPELGLLARPEALPHGTYLALREALSGIERLVPAEPALEEAMGGLELDGVLLVSRCSFGGPEPDVVKTARRLGVPSIMLVWSWDNLSSKAVLHEHPDHLLVWNDVQRAEAVDLHGFPAERVSVVGAPNFDRFFAEAEAGALRRPGAGDAPTILYLGSSSNVAPDEAAVVSRWLAAVRSSADPVVRDARVVVRPYPAGQERWRGWSPPDRRTAVTEPTEKIEPGTLAQLLADADCVVALNTSAEIEAAIADRPVLTFRAGADAPGQEGSLHFEYLLAEHGGFVIDAAGLDEHVARLSGVLRGDYDRDATGRFVERFVRPAGRSVPVAPLVASTILELAAPVSHPVAAR
jgi:hypothetical protein